jgi:hypothetical protein
MLDHVQKYIQGNDFDIPGMINDDYISAMRVLWQSKHYHSTLKLLLCFIDTMAFVSTGRSNPGSFKQWLTKFVELEGVGVTAEELWEHRNSVLHLSTYESIKVQEGRVRKLVPYVGKTQPEAASEHTYYDLHKLLMAVFHGVGAYVNAMNSSHEMRNQFCDNYEKTVSDAMVTHIK